MTQRKEYRKAKQDRPIAHLYLFPYIIISLLFISSASHLTFFSPFLSPHPSPPPPLSLSLAARLSLGPAIVFHSGLLMVMSAYVHMHCLRP